MNSTVFYLLTFVIIGTALVVFLLAANSQMIVKEADKEYCYPPRLQMCTLHYDPVCGYFNETVQCVKSPCAATYSNSCHACADEKVEYWKPGKCSI
jgi:hypothetical protein